MKRPHNLSPGELAIVDRSIAWGREHIAADVLAQLVAGGFQMEPWSCGHIIEGARAFCVVGPLALCESCGVQALSDQGATAACMLCGAFPAGGTGLVDGRFEAVCRTCATGGIAAQ